MNFYLNAPEGSGLEHNPEFATNVEPREFTARSEKGAVTVSKWETLFESGVGRQDLLALTHQLAATLGAGLSFMAALEILLRPGVHRLGMHRVVSDLAGRVQEGRPLSDALKAHPKVFDELYVSLVEAGEASAKLPDFLRRLAQFQERRNQLTYNVVGALLYPLFVLLFGLALGTTMLVYGAPIVEEMYRSAGAQLPWFSQIFITWGATIGRVALGLFCFAVLGLPLWLYLFRKRSVRLALDEKLLHWGPTCALFQELLTARTSRTLAVLYTNGIPILTALGLTGRSSGSPVYEDLFGQVAREVQEGFKVADTLMRSTVYPPMAAGMVAAGEEAGSLGPMLDHIADYYEARVAFTVDSLVKFLEPILILILGLFVGSVVIALGMPFLNLVEVLQ